MEVKTHRDGSRSILKLTKEQSEVLTLALNGIAKGFLPEFSETRKQVAKGLLQRFSKDLI